MEKQVLSAICLGNDANFRTICDLAPGRLCEEAVDRKLENLEKNRIHTWKNENSGWCRCQGLLTSDAAMV